jgi:hypothetical protein
VRPRSIPNEIIPGAKLPPWERFENFVGMIARISKDESDKENVATKKPIAVLDKQPRRRKAVS